MLRKDLIDMLLGNPLSVAHIARLVDESPRRVADDLNHLFRSLKHREYKAVVDPARCRACGFEFYSGEIDQASKCAECKSTWVQERKIRIERKTQAGEPK
jgi:predicted Zn-ribbon and HTH transcriptional regulator